MPETVIEVEGQVVAAGQAPGAYHGNFAAYTVDDLSQGDFQKMGLSPSAATAAECEQADQACEQE